MRTITQLLIIFLSQLTAAYSAPNILTCKLQGLVYELKLVVPPNIGDLPKIDFSYPADATVFSLRDGNLVLVAMDHEDKSRPRIMISAQKNAKDSAYHGQFMTDSGGNEVQIDNGPADCVIAK